MGTLPDFVPPMLARLGAAFDSDEHLFEIKWDGTRSLAFVEGGDYRLVSRKRVDQKPRYPELGFFAELPGGLVLDGELVVLRDGRPDFGLTMGREHARNRMKIEGLARTHPVTYAAFDVLYRDGVSLMDEPLRERRRHLEEVVTACGNPVLLFSEGVVGGGVAYFDKLTELELEGMVAKRLDSPYRPGRRTEDWTKVKRRQHLSCAILGYLPEGDDDLKSLVIAADVDGELRCVGRVGSGLTAAMRRKLVKMLAPRLRDEALVDCGPEGLWVEPGLYCLVSYLEITEQGGLRAPVFEGLIDADT